jgi:hypothetical protein
MSEAVKRRILTEDARVHSQVVRMKFVAEKMAEVTYSSEFSCFPYQLTLLILTQHQALVQQAQLRPHYQGLSSLTPLFK